MKINMSDLKELIRSVLLESRVGDAMIELEEEIESLMKDHSFKLVNTTPEGRMSFRKNDEIVTTHVQNPAQIFCTFKSKAYRTREIELHSVDELTQHLDKMK